MPLILNIDTATEYASVCISKGNEVLAMETNADQKNHGSFIQPAIQRLMNAASLTLQAFDAIAVTAGPGSYTGLRVGLATAKGLCYATQKPLILINTLEVMAVASIQLQTENQKPETENCLFCPMIDARRMEVFTALYDRYLNIVCEPAAKILDESSFKERLNRQPVIFSGSGQAKLKNILQHPNAFFSNAQQHAGHVSVLSIKAFGQKKFADIATSGPTYIKEFFTIAPQVLKVEKLL